jgi:hypothetical protein
MRMKKLLAVLAILALSACGGEAPPAEEAEGMMEEAVDTAAAMVDTMMADTVMARDTAEAMP